MGFRVSYGRRVSRPGLSVLDPTNRSTDPLNRSIGNPDIESSITHSINGGFNWTGRLGQVSLGPYWNQTNDGWERVTTVDTAGVSTSTWANLTSRTSVGTNLSLSPPRIWGWMARLNLSTSRSTLRGSLRPQGAEDEETALVGQQQPVGPDHPGDHGTEQLRVRAGARPGPGPHLGPVESRLQLPVPADGQSHHDRLIGPGPLRAPEIHATDPGSIGHSDRQQPGDDAEHDDQCVLCLWRRGAGGRAGSDTARLGRMRSRTTARAALWPRWSSGTSAPPRRARPRAPRWSQR